MLRLLVVSLPLVIIGTGLVAFGVSLFSVALTELRRRQALEDSRRERGPRADLYRSLVQGSGMTALGLFLLTLAVVVLVR